MARSYMKGLFLLVGFLLTCAFTPNVRRRDYHVE